MNKIAIIGLGPIGSILAAHLALNHYGSGLAQNKHPTLRQIQGGLRRAQSSREPGRTIVLVDVLKPHLDAIKSTGLVISGFKEINVKIPDVCYEICQLKNYELNYLFICVKATILRHIMPEVKKVIGKQTYVVSFQNGIDTEEEVAQHVGPERTLRVIINYAGNLIADGQVKMSFFNKPNYIGAVSAKAEDAAKQLAGLLTQSGLDTEFTGKIKKYAWEKTILNAALSPVTALTGQTMKQAMDFPETRRLVVSLLEEGINVAKAIGYDYGPDFMNHCLDYLDKAGHHKTSMHVDIESGRRTEIDFLNKKIVEYGEKLNLATPSHRVIVSLIKGIEDKIGNTK